MKELRCLTDEGVREDASKPSFFLRDGIIMRRSRPLTSQAENFSALDQIVVPVCYRDKIVEQGHAGLLWGHLGVQKTSDEIGRDFSGLV